MVQSEVQEKEINPDDTVTLPLPEPPKNTAALVSCLEVSGPIGGCPTSCARAASGTAIVNPAKTARNFLSFI
jgi:hypothetical protein